MSFWLFYVCHQKSCLLHNSLHTLLYKSLFKPETRISFSTETWLPMGIPGATFDNIATFSAKFSLFFFFMGSPKQFGVQCMIWHRVRGQGPVDVCRVEQVAGRVFFRPHTFPTSPFFPPGVVEELTSGRRPRRCPRCTSGWRRAPGTACNVEVGPSLLLSPLAPEHEPQSRLPGGPGV